MTFTSRSLPRDFVLNLRNLKKIFVCNLCTSYKNLNEVTEEREKAHKKHMDGKIFTRVLKEKQKEEARENKTVVTAAFDLQQVLLSQYGPTNAFYYSAD